MEVTSLDTLKDAVKTIGLPGVLKSNTMGYDGKGQLTISKDANLEEIWKEFCEKVGENNNSILEAFVDFQCEVSVIVVRGFDGDISTFPVVENIHENHILKETHVPALVSESVAKKADEASRIIAKGIGLVGVLAVEMFVTKDEKVMVNELAPRPHNSGHWSIEGCVTSQFEQMVRGICGLPLGSTKLAAKRIVMTNLLGNEIDQWKNLLSKEGVHLHLYGKTEAKPGRKMGHVTALFEE